MTSTNGGGSGWNLGRYTINTANGITEFRLGGILHVAAAQPAGVYHGTVARADPVQLNRCCQDPRFAITAGPWNTYRKSP